MTYTWAEQLFTRRGEKYPIRKGGKETGSTSLPKLLTASLEGAYILFGSQFQGPFDTFLLAPSAFIIKIVRTNNFSSNFASYGNVQTGCFIVTLKPYQTFSKKIANCGTGTRCEIF